MPDPNCPECKGTGECRLGDVEYVLLPDGSLCACLRVTGHMACDCTRPTRLPLDPPADSEGGEQ